MTGFQKPTAPHTPIAPSRTRRYMLDVLFLAPLVLLAFVALKFVHDNVLNESYKIGSGRYRVARSELPGKSRSDCIALLGKPNTERVVGEGALHRLTYFLRPETNWFTGIDAVWIYVEIDTQKDRIERVYLGTD